MKDILQKLKELRTARLMSRVKHLRGRHDQRDHNRWPAGYQAQTYVPTGRRGSAMAARVTGGLAGMTQTNLMMNQTKRLTPRVKTGEPSLFAPMPIDTSELQPGGLIYDLLTNTETSDLAVNLRNSIVTWRTRELLTYYDVKEELDSFMPSNNEVVFLRNFAAGHYNSSIFGANVIARLLQYIPDEQIEVMENANSEEKSKVQKFKEQYRKIDMVRKELSQIAKNKKISDSLLSDYQADKWKKKYDEINGVNKEYFVYSSLEKGINPLNAPPKWFLGDDFARFENLFTPHSADKDNLLFEKKEIDALNVAIKHFESQYLSVMKALDDSSKTRTKFLMSKKEGGYIKQGYGDYQKSLERVKMEKEILEDTRRNLVSSINSMMERRKKDKNKQETPDFASEMGLDNNLESLSSTEWANVFTKYYDDYIEANEIINLDDSISEAKSRLFGEANYDANPGKSIASFAATQQYQDYLLITKTMNDILNNNPFGDFLKLGNSVNTLFQSLQHTGLNHVLKSQKDFVSGMNEALDKMEKFAKLFTDEELSSDYTFQKEIEQYDTSVMTDALNNINKARRIVEAIGNIDIQGMNDILMEKANGDMSPESLINYFFDSSSDSRSSNLHIQRALGFIYDMQSYNGKPAVVNWNEILNPSSDVIKDANGQPLTLMRSVNGVSWTDSTQQDRGFEYVDDMRYGEIHYAGTGVSGYGTYMKSPNAYGRSESQTEITNNEDFNRDRAQNLQKLNDKASQLEKVINDYETPESVLDLIKSHLGLIKSYSSSVDNFDGHSTGVSVGRIGSLISMELDKLENTQGLVNVIAAYNDLLDSVSSAQSRNRPYTKDEANYYALMATRANYGKYSTGYTLNADARIPQTFVNGENSGNINHERVISLDTQINEEFKSRYPMLTGIRINIGIKMAMLGYDAYPAHVNSHSTNWVVLNRAILNVADTTIDPSYTDEEIHELIKWGKPVR